MTQPVHHPSLSPYHPAANGGCYGCLGDVDVVDTGLHIEGDGFIILCRGCMMSIARAFPGLDMVQDGDKLRGQITVLTDLLASRNQEVSALRDALNGLQRLSGFPVAGSQPHPPEGRDVSPTPTPSLPSTSLAVLDDDEEFEVIVGREEVSPFEGAVVTYTYPCPHCADEFESERGLKTHMGHKHKGE